MDSQQKGTSRDSSEKRLSLLIGLSHNEVKEVYMGR